MTQLSKKVLLEILMDWAIDDHKRPRQGFSKTRLERQHDREDTTLAAES
jgi:hypothetical protein